MILYGYFNALDDTKTIQKPIFREALTTENLIYVNKKHEVSGVSETTDNHPSALMYYIRMVMEW